MDSYGLNECQFFLSTTNSSFSTIYPDYLFTYPQLFQSYPDKILNYSKIDQSKSVLNLLKMV